MTATTPAPNAAPLSNTPRFELYSYWRTSATYRVRVAFNLKGVIPHEHNVDLDLGEQRRGPLTQSLAILEFLEELYPAPPLLPVGLHARARVRSIAGMLAADTHPLITPRVKKYLTGHAGFDEGAWRAWQIHWFTTGLQAVEARLLDEPQTGVFCHGDAVSLADICLASIVVVSRVFKIHVPDIPTVNRIVFACEKLAAFAAADPYRQLGAPAPIR